MQNFWETRLGGGSSTKIQKIQQKYKNNKAPPSAAPQGGRASRAPLGFVVFIFLANFLEFFVADFWQIFLADGGPSRFSPHIWLVDGGFMILWRRGVPFVTRSARETK